MTGKLVEPERPNKFCSIHKGVKVTRTKITDYAGGTRYVLRCPVCGITESLEQ